MFHRRPTALNQLAPAASISLARLSGVEGLSRSFLVGIVPLVALDALGSKQMVSYVYFFGAVLTMMITLNIGTLERLLNRRYVITLAGVFLILAASFLYFGTDNNEQNLGGRHHESLQVEAIRQAAPIFQNMRCPAYAASFLSACVWTACERRLCQCYRHSVHDSVPTLY